MLIDSFPVAVFASSGQKTETVRATEFGAWLIAMSVTGITHAKIEMHGQNSDMESTRNH